ncbi:MAG: nucleotidyltransferase family protein [Gammaproteobacteria bacterium]
MINSAVNIPHERMADLCRRYGIRSLTLFGSATRADFRPDSDIDVLVEFEKNAEASLFDLVEIARELSELFGNRAVDVVTPAVLRNPYRRRAILKDLERVYDV